MGVFDELRRRLKDRTAQDEYRGGDRPTELIREMNEGVVAMNPEQRSKQMKVIEAAVGAYYNGRHNEQIPADVMSDVRKLHQRVDRLNHVTEQMNFLMANGGPPTIDTVKQAVHESFMERQREYTKATQGKSAGKTKEKAMAVEAGS